ncbi:hypothetical protein BCR35DRAFT_20386 [Leucosporidium creatinivorum]|uniref:Zn(2)-C6 fungal-type domain-containing protein n=1 Tax=Leucosporidium creatinivorum TaxID=106004 RepID=A0A1Y2CXL6_9BASI|nr:hypothetical protein BCR35DRAFT_20386 [Leucosporidium creatinivorum]
MSASASPAAAQRKRRRAQDGAPVKPRSAACTACASRKVACKGLEVPGAVGCLSCVAHGLPCSRAPEGAKIVELDAVDQAAGGVRHREGKTISKLRRAISFAPSHLLSST